MGNDVECTARFLSFSRTLAIQVQSDKRTTSGAVGTKGLKYSVILCTTREPKRVHAQTRVKIGDGS